MVEAVRVRVIILAAQVFQSLRLCQTYFNLKGSFPALNLRSALKRRMTQTPTIRIGHPVEEEEEEAEEATIGTSPSDLIPE